MLHLVEQRQHDAEERAHHAKERAQYLQLLEMLHSGKIDQATYNALKPYHLAKVFIFYYDLFFMTIQIIYSFCN
jgi:hypothetical protein